MPPKKRARGSAGRSKRSAPTAASVTSTRPRARRTTRRAAAQDTSTEAGDGNLPTSLTALLNLVRGEVQAGLLASRALTQNVHTAAASLPHSSLTGTTASSPGTTFIPPVPVVTSHSSHVSTAVPSATPTATAQGLLSVRTIRALCARL